MKTIQERLFQVLQRVNRPGTFVSHGSLLPVLPGLEITNIGAVGFPLTAQQAALIRNSCEQAPYGKGEKTLVDTSVRRVWQMMPDKFRLKNPEWREFLLKIVKIVEEELGLEDQQLEPQLYNLLLYEPGCFFLPHRDGEKVDRMVATLVLVLPSAFRGGELIVRHDGQESVIDFGAQEDSAYRTHFAAFYADCEHEVLPLREGFRLCLVYNLVLRNSKGSVAAPCTTERIDQMKGVLQDFGNSAGEADLQKLVVKLDHRYTRTGLAWDTLKGIDRTKAHILREAASAADCTAHIAELTYWEQGLGGKIYGRRGRRHRDYDTNSGASYVMHEIYETSLTARLWVTDGEKRIPFGVLSVEEDEVVPPGGLTDVKPEEQFEGYMGNYGETLDRWYRHAAIVLWPKNSHFDVVCQLGTNAAIVELRSMVQDLQAARPGQLLDLKAGCIELAKKIIDKWQPSSDELDWQPAAVSDEGLDFDDEDADEDYEDDYRDSGEDDEDDSDTDEVSADSEGDSTRDVVPVPPPGDDDVAASFISCLELLGDVSLTQAFLRVIVPKDDSVKLTTSFLDYCGKLGLAQLHEDFKHIYRSTTADTLERNIGLFDLLCSPECCSSDEYSRLRSAVVLELLAALKCIDKQKDDWRSSKIDRVNVLADLVKPLIATGDFEGLASLVSYTLGSPQRYAPRLLAKLLCQLKHWLLQNCVHSCAVTTWLDSCLGFLQTQTAREPQKPADFRREANVSCRCDDCKELIDFLKNPTQSVYRFKVRQERRAHLHQIIDSNGCDLNHVTERKGSPQTLVCTKNTNSYQRSLQQFREDTDNLADLQSLRKQLVEQWDDHR